MTRQQEAVLPVLMKLKAVLNAQTILCVLNATKQPSPTPQAPAACSHLQTVLLTSLKDSLPLKSKLRMEMTPSLSSLITVPNALKGILSTGWTSMQTTGTAKYAMWLFLTATSATLTEHADSAR